jgi:hypothetical protein
MHVARVSRFACMSCRYELNFHNTGQLSFLPDGMATTNTCVGGGNAGSTFSLLECPRTRLLVEMVSEDGSERPCLAIFDQNNLFEWNVDHFAGTPCGCSSSFSAPLCQTNTTEGTWANRAPDPVHEFEAWVQHARLWCDANPRLIVKPGAGTTRPWPGCRPGRRPSCNFMA